MPDQKFDMRSFILGVQLAVLVALISLNVQTCTLLRKIKREIVTPHPELYVAPVPSEKM
jgi:hypothetical protein